MRIGIDIDDTITNTWEDVVPFYSLLFDVPIEKLKKNKPYYNSLNDRYTKEEYFKLIQPIYDNISPRVSLKKDVVNVFHKLHDKGHKIILISSRGEGFTDAYKLTKEYLDKNNVVYDKIIVGASRDKAKACLEERIDLFIDDSYKHCMNVSKIGVKVLMADAYYNKDCLEFPHLKNWNDIYKYIENR